jgi:hypothetical protein
MIDTCSLNVFNDLVGNDYGQIKLKIYRFFEWFLKAQHEEEITDMFISYFISLDSLLTFGSDPGVSLSEEMAENIAMMLTNDPDQRYKFKKRAKEIYNIRSRVFHNGYKIPDENADVIFELKTFCVWANQGILIKLPEILKYGTEAKAMREYFQRRKLSCE